MPKNVYRDDPTPFSGSTLRYYLYKNGRTALGAGGTMVAYDFPITVYLNRYAQAYLGNNFPGVENGVVADPDASGKFTMVNRSTWEVVAEETYISAYAGDFNELMAEPIDGKADPRQKLYITFFKPVETNVHIHTEEEEYDGGGGSEPDDPSSGSSEICHYEWVRISPPAWVSTYVGEGPNYYTTVNGVQYWVYGRRRLKQDGPGYPYVYRYDCVY